MVSRPIVVALLAALSLAACSSGGEQSQGGASRPASGAASGVGANPTTPTTQAPLPVIATRRTADGNRTIEVALNAVQVRGQVMEVTFTARPVGDNDSRWQVSTFFSDGIYDAQPPYTTNESFTVDGVYVIDGAAAKRYLVARDAHQLCVCSGNLSDTFATPAQGVVLTAAFKAPPADVSSVDVVIPKAGTFSGVPLSR